MKPHLQNRFIKAYNQMRLINAWQHRTDRAEQTAHGEKRQTARDTTAEQATAAEQADIDIAAPEQADIAMEQADKGEDTAAEEQADAAALLLLCDKAAAEQADTAAAEQANIVYDVCDVYVIAAAEQVDATAEQADTPAAGAVATRLVNAWRRKANIAPQTAGDTLQTAGDTAAEQGTAAEQADIAAAEQADIAIAEEEVDWGWGEDTAAEEQADRTEEQPQNRRKFKIKKSENIRRKAAKTAFKAIAEKAKKSKPAHSAADALQTTEDSNSEETYLSLSPTSPACEQANTTSAQADTAAADTAAAATQGNYMSPCSPASTSDAR